MSKHFGSDITITLYNAKKMSFWPIFEVVAMTDQKYQASLITIKIKSTYLPVFKRSNLANYISRPIYRSVSSIKPCRIFCWNYCLTTLHNLAWKHWSHSQCWHGMEFLAILWICLQFESKTFQNSCRCYNYNSLNKNIVYGFYVQVI